MDFKTLDKKNITGFGHVTFMFMFVHEIQEFKNMFARPNTYFKNNIFTGKFLI